MRRGTPEALLAVLRECCIVPDGIGEIHILNHAQAAAIRKSGYTAVANRVWRAPIFPHELVAGTVLQHLSDACDRAWGRQLGEWHPYRSHLEGYKRDAYAAMPKAMQPDLRKGYCPTCRQLLVHA